MIITIDLFDILTLTFVIFWIGFIFGGLGLNDSGFYTENLRLPL